MKQPEAKITLTQPLFNGLSEYATMRQAKDQIDAQVENKKGALKALGNSLSQVYFSILSLNGDIQNYKEEMQQYNKRIQELEERIKIGLSRLTERLTVEAALASLEATVEQINGNLAASRVNLAYYTGLDPATPVVPIKGEVPTVAPLQTYLALGATRPELKAAELAMHSAQEQININRAGHFPSVSAFTDYYLNRETAVNNARWDIGISLTLPIYSGGLVNAKMDEAVTLYSQAELAWILVRDQVHQEISTYYAALQSDMQQYKKFQNAYDINRRNLGSIEAEYRNGLVTNLDVLTAMTSYADAKRQLLESYHAIKLDECNLYLAQGKDPFSLDMR